MTAALAVAFVGMTPGPALADDSQWYIDAYQIQQFHDQGIDGTGVTIAVIDGGINPNVMNLQGADINIKEPSYCVPFDGTDRPVASTDYEYASHGTNVVSMIVGNGTSENGPGPIGIAPKATINYYGNNFGDHTSCDPNVMLDYRPDVEGSTRDVIAMFIDAVDDGADIISVSATMNFPEPDMIAYALRHNVIVVAGVANADIMRSSERNFTLDGMIVGANGVLGVDAISSDGTIALASDGKPKGYNPNRDVTAPGVDILVAAGEGWSGSTTWSGTSLATPIVAGNIALAMQKYPEATPNQIIQSVIHNTGANPHELDWDAFTGYGLVDTISLLAADPTQYPDVNPLLTAEGGEPTIEQVYGTPSATPSPSETPAATETPTPTAPAEPSTEPTTASSGLSPLVIIATAVAALLIAAGIITTVILTRRKRPDTLNSASTEGGAGHERG